jgi:hypothetical protein
LTNHGAASANERACRYLGLDGSHDPQLRHRRAHRRREDTVSERRFRSVEHRYGTSTHIPFGIRAGGTAHSRGPIRVSTEGRNVHICPAGAALTTSGRVNSDHAIRYFASVPRCRECPLKQRCCPNMPSRRIVRDVNEAARDVARRKMQTKAFLKSRDQRKRVEMRFAHLKTHHGFERMRLPFSGARDLKTHGPALLGPPPKLAQA